MLSLSLLNLERENNDIIHLSSEQIWASILNMTILRLFHSLLIFNYRDKLLIFRLLAVSLVFQHDSLGIVIVRQKDMVPVN